MPNHSNNLQKWISKNESNAIEKLIADIESKYPLEIVVAFTDRPALVPVAAARMIALLALLLELLAEIFWWPVPAWIMGLVVFAFLMMPIGQWQSNLLFRILSRSPEKQASISAQAEVCFNELGLARTKARNALLVFFNMKERTFHLLPDRTIHKEWPEFKMDVIAETLNSRLNAKESPGVAALHLLERVRILAQERWPEFSPSDKVDELPNAIAWWDGSSVKKGPSA